MRNIELKARLRDRENAIEACRGLNAQPQGDIHQVDTYFRVPRGRLKLRENDPGRRELVFYERADLTGPKRCDYLLCGVDGSSRELLKAALGELAVVDKVRTLFLWQNVRIHLDRVAGLGEFIEFEAVLSDVLDDADGHAKLDRLQHVFRVAPQDLVRTSYLELILATPS